MNSATRYTNLSDMKRDEYRYWQSQPAGTRFLSTLNWTLEVYGLHKSSINVPDYVALLAAFQKHGVAYLIVGGYAVNYYAQPRVTQDLDIWIRASGDNAKRVYAALAEWGAPLATYTPEDFAEAGSFFRFGFPPLGLDVLTGIPGILFDDAWGRRTETSIEGGPHCVYIGRDDLIQAKRASGRTRDLADVEDIEASGSAQP